MNNFVFRVTSLLAGLLFGLGMAISGMTDPNKVIGFLDVAGDWDPSLMFVMGGALAVFMPGYFLLVKKQQKPLNAEAFCLATKKTIDGRLVSGAAVFGIGWGLAGICPGPAVASLGLGNVQIVLFFAAMMFGLGVTNLLICFKNEREVKTELA
ncbi:YeeE/YedE family protein [Vibrio sp. IRLE0018]|uniref:YeeE/YedE family protein n=1 Tax=Vibrio floridensis TaxID=2908007 RepID=UPI001A30DC09|nr:YeeE/YedE family protein [Vibrio floridensis]MCF8777927.1 YeeE/YedE family protein [Vibrio floridensis]HAS6347084.1 YeeE/YedE family protein [Vibrio vulnificus]